MRWKPNNQTFSRDSQQLTCWSAPSVSGHCSKYAVNGTETLLNKSQQSSCLLLDSPRSFLVDS